MKYFIKNIQILPIILSFFKVKKTDNNLKMQISWV